MGLILWICIGLCVFNLPIREETVIAASGGMLGPVLRGGKKALSPVKKAFKGAKDRVARMVANYRFSSNKSRLHNDLELIDRLREEIGIYTDPNAIVEALNQAQEAVNRARASASTLRSLSDKWGVKDEWIENALGYLENQTIPDLDIISEQAAKSLKEAQKRMQDIQDLEFRIGEPVSESRKSQIIKDIPKGKSIERNGVKINFTKGEDSSWRIDETDPRKLARWLSYKSKHYGDSVQLEEFYSIVNDWRVIRKALGEEMNYFSPFEKSLIQKRRDDWYSAGHTKKEIKEELEFYEMALADDADAIKRLLRVERKNKSNIAKDVLSFFYFRLPFDDAVKNSLREHGYSDYEIEELNIYKPEPKAAPESRQPPVPGKSLLG